VWPNGDNGLRALESLLGQIDFDVDPFAVTGIYPGQNQYNMARGHLTPDRSPQLSVGSGVMDGIILRN